MKTFAYAALLGLVLAEGEEMADDGAAAPIVKTLGDSSAQGGGYTSDGAYGEALATETDADGNMVKALVMWAGWETSGNKFGKGKWAVNFTQHDNLEKPGTYQGMSCAAKWDLDATAATDYSVMSWGSASMWADGGKDESFAGSMDPNNFVPGWMADTETSAVSYKSETTGKYVKKGSLKDWNGLQACGGWLLLWSDSAPADAQQMYFDMIKAIPTFTGINGFRICDDATCSGTPIAGGDSEMLSFTFADWGDEVTNTGSGSGAASLLATGTALIAAALMF